MNVHEVLDQIAPFRRSGAGWTARCPGPNHKHDDRTPSLSIAEGDNGAVLLKCHAGCTFEEILAAKGWKAADLFAQSNGSQSNTHPERRATPPAEGQKFSATEDDVERMRADLVASPECQRYIEGRGISMKVAADLRWGFEKSWTFRSEEGNSEEPALAIPHAVSRKLVGIKFRTISEAKRFSQITGSTITGLYGAWLLNSAAEDVLVLEGPEDCALAITHGWNATAINSASATRFEKHDIALLRGYKRIFLVGDHDAAGLKAMNEVAAQLPAEKVIRVPFFGFKDVGDLWKDDPKGFKEKFRRILRLARAARPNFDLEDLLSEEELRIGAPATRYAIARLVPLNAVTMIFAEEKSGKSILTTYLCKCVANKLPAFGKYETVKMPVIVLDLDAGDGDIAEYIKNFEGLGPEKIRYLTRTTGVPALDSQALLDLCRRWRPLILIESFTKFFSLEREGGQKSASAFDPTHVSRFFDKVLGLCAAGATIIITHHATRDEWDRYADSHQIGAAVARAYAVRSLDRPNLGRVRLECTLSRGAEPESVNLIAFPVIGSTGHFGLSAEDPLAADIEALLAFVKDQPSESCSREAIKKRPGRRASANLTLLNSAVERRLLVIREDRKVAFPNAGTVVPNLITFPEPGTDGNET